MGSGGCVWTTKTKAGQRVRRPAAESASSHAGPAGIMLGPGRPRRRLRDGAADDRLIAVVTPSEDGLACTDGGSASSPKRGSSSPPADRVSRSDQIEGRAPVRTVAGQEAGDRFGVIRTSFTPARSPSWSFARGFPGTACLQSTATARERELGQTSAQPVPASAGISAGMAPGNWISAAGNTPAVCTPGRSSRRRQQLPVPLRHSAHR